MAVIKCGFSQADITPVPNGTFQDGYGFRVNPATGVRDNLYAKVCAFICGEDTFLLFSFDLCGMSPAVYNTVAGQISCITGIKKERMALCCTHTHAGPACGVLDELPINYDYYAFIGARAANAALRAIDGAAEGSFFSDIPEAEIIHSFNRRGRPFIDRSIHTAAFVDTSGKLRGVICSASCHAVFNTGSEISADWLAVLNKVSCDDVPYMFLQGRGADINPNGDQGADLDGMIDTLGSELAVPVKAFAEKCSGVSADALDAEMRCGYEMTCIPMMRHDDTAGLKGLLSALTEQYLSFDENDINRRYTFREMQWARHMIRMAENNESFDLRVPMAYFTLGDKLAFAFVPFEMLTETGNRIEKLFVSRGFERRNIFVCGYSNSVNGYLAPPEEFEVGGYEVSGAAHWYNIPQTCPESEPAVVAWFEKNV